MRDPIIKVSAVALIGLLSLSLTSCRTDSAARCAELSGGLGKREWSAGERAKRGFPKFFSHGLDAKCHGEC